MLAIPPSKPQHLTLDHLESLNKTGWEKWIKTYGVPSSPWYSMAIDSAAEYAKEHASEWDDFRKKIVDDPRSIYKFCHSGTMKNRIAFFQTVDCRRIERQRTIEFQQQISGLQQLRTQSDIISTLTTRLDSQADMLKESSGSKSVLESRLEALEQMLKIESEKRAFLEQRLEEETEKREALEREIEELKAQKTVEAASVTVAPESDHTEVDMTKVSESFSSQIKELHTQLDELKASISTGDSELTAKIQSLSEKVDAMDLEGIRADVETILTYIGIDKAPKSKNPLAIRVATFSAIYSFSFIR